MDAERTSVNDLNEDCLYQIFSLLNLLEQINVSKVCEKFFEVSKHIWRTNKKERALDVPVWKSMLPRIDDLGYFLNIMQEYITEFSTCYDDPCNIVHDFNNWNIKQLKHCKKCTLIRNVYNSLRFPFLSCDLLVMYDLTKIFPNVKYLRIDDDITGMYLNFFTNLEELHLYNAEEKMFEISNVNLAKICMELKMLKVLDIRNFNVSQLQLPYIDYCKNLEILKLNLYVLIPIVNNILKLPKLKTLVVLYDFNIDVSIIVNVDTFNYRIFPTAEFFHIINSASDRIIGMSIDHYYMNLRKGWDQNLELFNFYKLEHFAFCGSNFDPVMLEKYAKMKNLKSLWVRMCETMSKAILLKFIELCPQLTDIDITGCSRLNSSFLYDALNLIKALKHKPINIYYQLSGLDDEIENLNPKFWIEQNYINCIKGVPENVNYAQRGFHFDFESLEARNLTTDIAKADQTN